VWQGAAPSFIIKARIKIVDHLEISVIVQRDILDKIIKADPRA
jgi:hypothetical protein